MKIFQTTLNINGFVQERKDRTENCGGGWLAYISENLEYIYKCKRKLILKGVIWDEVPTMVEIAIF